MGRLLTNSPRHTLAQLRLTLFGQLQYVRAAETFQVSHRPKLEALLLCPVLCVLTSSAPHPGPQCLCLCGHCLLLAHDPHRRHWHSLNLPSTPASAALAAATAISAGDRGGEQHPRPDQCTRQHRRRSHCPCPRHLLPQCRAQHHQERRPRGGGGRLGRAGCTSQLLESAPCAVHQPGLVWRRATDWAQHHRG